MAKMEPLQVDGLSTHELLEKIRELHENLVASVQTCYDLGEQYKARQYDIIELTERVRQMSKGGGGKRDRSMSMAVGNDRLSDKYQDAPAKVELCSKFDRKTDSRSYDQRRELYASPLAKPAIPSLPSALLDKVLDSQILANNRNLLPYDRVRLRTASLSNLAVSSPQLIPVNSVMAPPRLGLKALKSIGEDETE